MEDLIGVIDESGKYTLDYVCFIIGDSKSINFNASKISSKFTHMTSMPEHAKLPLLKTFDFSGNILACCMHLGLLELEEKVEKYNNKKNNNKDKKRFISTVGYELEFKLRRVYDNFMRENNRDIKDIEFVIDNNTLGEYLRSGGLKTKFKKTENKKVHDVADCVAHANYKKMKFNDKIIEFIDDDFKPHFHDSIMDVIKQI